MADQFDPYYTWLAIPREEQPPDYYRLLGVRKFENNPEVISNAMDQRMAHIRSFQSGARAAVSQRLLNELSQAGGCLLNTDRKANYDRDLRQKDAPKVAKAASPVLQARPLAPPPRSAEAPPIPVGVALPVQESPRPIVITTAKPLATESAEGVAPRTAPAGMSPAVRSAILAGASCAAVLIIGSLALWAIFGRGGSNPAPPKKGHLEGLAGTSKPDLKPNTPDEPADERAKPDDPQVETPPEKPEATPGTSNPPVAAALPQPPDSGTLLQLGAGEFIEVQNSKGLADPAKVFTVEAWLRLDPKAAAHFIAGDRVDGPKHPDVPDDSAAGWRFRLIPEKEALTYTAALAGVSNESTLKIKLADAPLHHVAVCAANGKLTAYVDGKYAVDHEEEWSTSPLNLHLGGHEFLEKGMSGLGGDFIAARVSSNCRYTKSFSPPPIFEADADTLVALDASLNANGNILQDRSNHRRYGVYNSGTLLVTKRPGENVVAKKTEPEPSPKPEEHPFGARPGEEPRPGFGEPPPKAASKGLAPPDTAAQDKARTEVRSIFKQQLTKAVKPLEKVALAQELFKLAKDEKEQPATRYVLFEEARNLALEAGNFDSAFMIVDAVAGAFETDAWKLKSAALKRGAEVADTNDERKRLAEMAIKIGDAAFAAGNFEIAGEASAIATTAAGRVGETKLKTSARNLQTTVDAGKKQHDLAQLAFERLKTEPDNPKANLAWGKYVAFVKRDWKEALPYLAKGDSESLKVAATADLALPKEAEKQAALGDLWYEVGKAGSGREKESLLLRAREWYQKSLAEAGGLTKLRVTKSLDEIAAALPKEEGLGGHATWVGLGVPFKGPSAGNEFQRVELSNFRMDKLQFAATYSWKAYENRAIGKGEYAIEGLLRGPAVEWLCRANGAKGQGVLRDGTLLLAWEQAPHAGEAWYIPAASAKAGAVHQGKYRIMEEGRNVFEIELCSDGTVKRINNPFVHGAWLATEDRVHVVWSDGWRELHAKDSTGTKRIAFRPGDSMLKPGVNPGEAIKIE